MLLLLVLPGGAVCPICRVRAYHMYVSVRDMNRYDIIVSNNMHSTCMVRTAAPGTTYSMYVMQSQGRPHTVFLGDRAFFYIFYLYCNYRNF